MLCSTLISSWSTVVMNQREKQNKIQNFKKINHLVLI